MDSLKKLAGAVILGALSDAHNGTWRWWLEVSVLRACSRSFRSFYAVPFRDLCSFFRRSDPAGADTESQAWSGRCLRAVDDNQGSPLVPHCLSVNFEG